MTGGFLICRFAGPALIFIAALAGCASTKSRGVAAPAPPALQAVPTMTPEEIMTRKRALFGQAQQAFQEGNYDQAISGWEDVLKIDPNHGPSKSGIERARAAKAAQAKP